MLLTGCGPSGDSLPIAENPASQAVYIKASNTGATDQFGWAVALDGDTLVVTTKNFKERSVYRNANAETLTLTERFQRIASDKVRWTVTVDDPSTWTKPWTFSLPLTADPNPLPLYECHEGNYGLKNILSAARAEEQQK